MIEDFDTTEPEDAPEDPAGEVMLPPTRREIVRAYALAGVAIGLSALIGLAGGGPTPGITPTQTA